MTKLATYKTQRGAQRYAAEIHAKFPSVRATPVPTQGFLFGVLVTTAQGHTAMALKRPTGYGRGYPADILQGNFRVPNDGGL